MMGNVIESIADVVFAMTGAVPSAGNRPGRWWRQRFWECCLILGLVVASAVLLGARA